jgi:hypothetical protein
MPREAFQPIVQWFVESCEYAPADGRGNPAECGTVCIRGMEQTDTVPRTEDGGSAGAIYALVQIPRLLEVYLMDFDALLCLRQ